MERTLKEGIVKLRSLIDWLEANRRDECERRKAEKEGETTKESGNLERKEEKRRITRQTRKKIEERKGFNSTNSVKKGLDERPSAYRRADQRSEIEGKHEGLADFNGNWKGTGKLRAFQTQIEEPSTKTFEIKHPDDQERLLEGLLARSKESAEASAGVQAEERGRARRAASVERDNFPLDSESSRLLSLNLDQLSSFFVTPMGSKRSKLIVLCLGSFGRALFRSLHDSTVKSPVFSLLLFPRGCSFFCRRAFFPCVSVDNFYDVWDYNC
ncbi:hypothetical protein CSUI_006957 [Cystoisospora suis]|uniref:Uncharacterized protein n=1 Tax=Cystoisospora suis TaxID=483139 RepID=A0A2C6JXK0_9APIC|nr:hypothetical protein CSUI_006957 [Cystoisospora suis]